MNTPRRSAGGMAAAVLLTVCALLLMLAVMLSYNEKPETVYEASGRRTVVEPVARQTGEIPVNSAGLAELMKLPGVGEITGQAIIDERILHGPYYYPEDLLAVRGVGPVTLAKRRDMLDFTGPEEDEP